MRRDCGERDDEGQSRKSKVRVRVRIGQADRATEKALAASSNLSEQALEVLREAAARVPEWLAGDRKRGAWLLVDPEGALRELAPQADPKVLAELLANARAAKARRVESIVMPEGVEIESITVEGAARGRAETAT